MEPQEIVDQPIPLLEGGDTSATGNNSNPVLSEATVPTKQVDVSFPPVNIAVDTIGTSINTETKKILAEYSFESQGAIRVGEFIQGVSGEIDISPDGIVGINVNGETTFAINGTNGNTYFKGTVAAGSVISGDLQLGGSGNGDGILSIFDSSNVQKVQGDNTGLTVYDLASFGFYDTSVGSKVATLGADGASNVAFSPNGPGVGFKFNSDVTVTKDVSCLTLHVNGSVKTAIVPIYNGYSALYAIESPEVWFMDFCKTKDMIDPNFLEVTEGEMHFILLDTEIGYQVWRRRKGYKDTRFQSKTREEFEQNEKFLSLSKLDN